MARRKMAWNMTNPLYRYLHGGGKRKRKHTRSVRHMARRRRFGRRSGGFGGGGILMRGLLGPKVGMGLLGAALAGAGAVYAAKRFAPGIVATVPFGENGVAAAAGGIPGLVGNMLAGKFLNGGAGSSTAW